MHQGTPVRTTLVVGLALALGICQPLVADYQKSFSEGIKAMDREDWPAVTRWMRQAISEQPTAGGRRINIYGTRTKNYLPHYYLGLSLYRVGDVTGALEAWRTSEQQGTIYNSPEQSELREHLEDLWSRLRKEAIGEREQARQLVADIEALLADEGMLSALRGQASLARRWESSRQRALDAEPGHEAPANLSVNAIAEPVDLLASIRQELEQLRREITALEPLSSSKDGPPEVLRRAAEAFLSGDYDGCLRLLGSWNPPTPEASFHHHLLRAACYFGRHRLQGDDSEQDLGRARQEIRHCQSFDPTFRPPEAVFSPSFRSFYDSR